ncbi:hypothetical protein [Hydrogenophaga sp.]|uniref:hypothetical protein n=1 Tax=Hydrogenophaga sp. TaxID=1904254 RepID=UPI0027318CAD|nr:hypothetical protein [Hydrogenophaga sp.]MDP2074605.1 hypothetical protein [Hydrogenophaga sp.]MDP3106426.1 hypothetical protein [Hydrogenophaga sp.]
MNLQFAGKHKATIADIDIQSLKMGQTDVVPAVCLTLKLTLANSTLKMLDPTLLNFLFEKGLPAAAQQQVLDGVPVVSDLPQLTDAAMALGALNWDGEQTGATLKIYQGVTGDQDITLADCTVRKVKVEPKEGGAVEWKFEVYTADVDEHTIGALGILKSLTRDIELDPAKALSAQQREIQADPLTPEKALGKASKRGATAEA